MCLILFYPPPHPPTTTEPQILQGGAKCSDIPKVTFIIRINIPQCTIHTCICSKIKWGSQLFLETMWIFVCIYVYKYVCVRTMVVAIFTKFDINIFFLIQQVKFISQMNLKIFNTFWESFPTKTPVFGHHNCCFFVDLKINEEWFIRFSMFRFVRTHRIFNAAVWKFLFCYTYSYYILGIQSMITNTKLTCSVMRTERLRYFRLIFVPSVINLKRYTPKNKDQTSASML